MMVNDLQSYPAKSSWAKSVKSLLDNLRFGHVWKEQGVGNIIMFYVSSKKDEQIILYRVGMMKFIIILELTHKNKYQILVLRII